MLPPVACSPLLLGLPFCTAPFHSAHCTHHSLSEGCLPEHKTHKRGKWANRIMCESPSMSAPLFFPELGTWLNVGDCCMIFREKRNSETPEDMSNSFLESEDINQCSLLMLNPTCFLRNPWAVSFLHLHFLAPLVVVFSYPVFNLRLQLKYLHSMSLTNLVSFEIIFFSTALSLS